MNRDDTDVSVLLKCCNRKVYKGKMTSPTMTWSKLINYLIAMAAGLLMFQGVYGQEDPGAATTTPSGIQDIDLAAWQKSHNEGQSLLVLLYQPEACDKCQLALDSVTQVVGQPEVPAGLEIVKSSNPDLLTHIEVKEFPSLVYLKDKSHVTYDGRFGVEDLLEWVQLAANHVVHKLNDDSFEHLTQASSGATTGDWLVAFYKDSCKTVLPLLRSFSVRFHGRTNVATVQIDDSPNLATRFKISDCSEIIFFKQGKMYRYTLPALDVASFRSFVDGFYKNVQAQVVPVPKSRFDLITENIADYVKVQLEGDNKAVVLAGLSAVGLLFLVITLCCCRSTVREAGKPKTE
jgi:hypothetical protein